MCFRQCILKVRVRDGVIVACEPDGIDRGGVPGFLIHDEEVPMTIIGMFPCKGLVQIEKWEGA